MFNIFAYLTRTPRRRLTDMQTEALMDRIDHQKNAEFHLAMVKMLDKRVARIQKELDANPDPNAMLQLSFEESRA